MIESNEQYFRRRHEERDAREEARASEERKHLQQWQTQLDDLVQQFDSDVKGLLTAFAREAPEIADYQVCGPEELGHQINWSIEYTRGNELSKRAILVVLRYLRPPERGAECVPDCFSLEGLIGLNTIKPPTIEALRKALGDARFRS